MILAQFEEVTQAVMIPAQFVTTALLVRLSLARFLLSQYHCILLMQLKQLLMCFTSASGDSNLLRTPVELLPYTKLLKISYYELVICICMQKRYPRLL